MGQQLPRHTAGDGDRDGDGDRQLLLGTSELGVERTGGQGKNKCDFFFLSLAMVPCSRVQLTADAFAAEVMHGPGGRTVTWWHCHGAGLEGALCPPCRRVSVNPGAKRTGHPPYWTCPLLLCGTPAVFPFTPLVFTPLVFTPLRTSAASMPL